MNFAGVSVEQAIAYYHEAHKQKFNKIKGKQHETFVKQVESMLNVENTCYLQKLDKLLFKYTETIDETTDDNMDLSESLTKSKISRKTIQPHRVTNILYFPPEVISTVLHHTEAKSRFNVAQSCHLMADIIHDIVGYKRVYLKRIPDILKIREYKGVMNNSIITLTNMDNSYTLYSLLSGCCNIDVASSSNIDITDNDLEELAGVHRIKLRWCRTITDKGVKALAGVHTIHLENTKVTDKGVKALAGVHTIHLGGTYVTDEGIKALKGVHAIQLGGTSVTDEGVKALKGVHEINIYNTVVTDEGIKALCEDNDLHILDIGDTDDTDITNECLDALKDVQIVTFDELGVNRHHFFDKE